MIPFLTPILAGIGGLASGAVSLGAGAVTALTSGATSLAGTAIGAGGSVLSSIGELGGGIFQTGAGIVSNAGTALFGGQASVPVLTGGEMGSLSQASLAGTGGGLFSNLSLDTLGNIAQAGFQTYMTLEQMDLAEKSLEAQRGAGYVVGAPAPSAPVTSLAPTTSIAIPAAATAAKELDTKVMIKYAIIALIAYLLFKGLK